MGEMTIYRQKDGTIAKKQIELDDWLEIKECPECGGRLKIVDDSMMMSPFAEKFVKRCVECNLYVFTLSPEDERLRKTELWEYDKMRDEEFQSRREEERGGFYE